MLNSTEYDARKIKNTPIPSFVPTKAGLNANVSSFTPNAKPFTPGGFKQAEPAKPREPTPPPRDVVADKFTKWTHTERETNDFKDIVAKL